MSEYGIQHRDGVPWHQAPIPRHWHRCQWQTTGKIDGEVIYRCACGAACGPDGIWVWRNSRRKDS